MKRVMGYLLAVILCLPCLGPLATHGATQAEINNSLQLGLAWLAAQQNADGSWPGSGYSVGNTGLALNALIHYAKDVGQDPFSPGYVYSANVIAGLDYILGQAQRDVGNQRIDWNSNYEWGPAVMAITVAARKDRVVDLPGSDVHGMTYLQIVEEALRHIEAVQLTAGDAVGSWDYYPTGTRGDMSAAGWVSLGLGYASYNFDIILSATLLSRLSQSIDAAQWTGDSSDPRYGGAGYRSTNSYGSWINLYKAGHLLYMLSLVGDAPSSARVQRVMDHILSHWNKPNSGRSGYPAQTNGEFDMGWRGGSPDPLPSYIATVAMMKAFVAWGLTTIGAGIDWYDEMTDVIVARQNPDGSWDQGGYPTHYTELATIWALLTMLRAAPASGSITDIATTTATFIAETDEDGTGYWVVVPRGALAPTPAQILAGTDGADAPAVDAGSGPMVADTPHHFPLTGLQPGTRYEVYFVNQLAAQTYSSIVRVQFTTLSQGSVIDVSGVIEMQIIGWAVNYDTGALIATVRVEYPQGGNGKPELHTAFWYALPDSANDRLEQKDGTASDGKPYTDVTGQIVSALQAGYGREVMQPGDVVVFDVGIFSRDRTPLGAALHALWADPPTHVADVNADGVIDDFEILAVVDDWYAGTVSDADFLSAIEVWRGGAAQ